MVKQRDMGQPSKHGSVARIVLVLLILALLVLTAWNVTRTDALAEAAAAMERKDLVGALRASLDTLERQPWSREATRLTAESLSKLDHADAAEPYYRRLGLDALSLDDLHVRAYGLVRSNQREKAIRAYEEILQRDPFDTLALRRLAGVQMTQANDPEVLSLAARLIEIPGGAVYGYTLRGVIEHNQKNREDAAAAFVKVIALDPDLKIMPLPHKIFWGNFAYDLLDTGRGADVRRYITEPAEKAADSYLMNAVATAYYLDGDFDNAERCFRKSAEWDANDPVSRLYLGKIQVHRRQPESAIAFLENAIKIAPKHHDSLYTLATTYRQLGRLEEAKKLQPLIDELREAKAVTPSPPVPKTPLPRYAL